MKRSQDMLFLFFQVSSSSPNFHEATLEDEQPQQQPPQLAAAPLPAPPPPPPETASVSVQTPNKLLKGLILESSSSSKDKSQSEAVKAAEMKLEKKFKQYIDKVRTVFMIHHIRGFIFVQILRLIYVCL